MVILWLTDYKTLCRLYICDLLLDLIIKPCNNQHCTSILTCHVASCLSTCVLTFCACLYCLCFVVYEGSARLHALH